AVDISGVPTPRPDFQNQLSIPMPQSLVALADRPVSYFAHSPSISPAAQDKFQHDLIRLNNNIHAEINGRAAFAVSSLILVIVGCALGMMFQSGNFLNAFAISVIPAILIISLII